MKANLGSVVLLGGLLGGLLVGCGGEADAPRRPNALLITLDTTRADVVGAFGGRAGVTPFLDALALESVAFPEARTVTPLTLPSHCSMLTGLTPPRHTVRVNSVRPLPQDADTLAERARDAGYQTAAVVAAIALDGSFGVSQGFDVYDQPVAPTVQTERAYDELPADEITDRALAWLERRDPDRPFLLWVHYFDPHIPHKAPAQFARGRSSYEAEVAFMDAEVGRLLAGLRAEGLLDTTLVTVVADHGESNGDHGEATHGAFCFDATLRVPYLMRYPDGFGAGTRHASVVSVTDVFPTYLEYLGLGSAGDVDGRSLYRRAELDDRGAYFESHYGFLLYGWSPLAGWVTSDTKLVQSATPALYDLARDRGERTNILDTAPDRAAPLRRSLEELLARPALADDGAVVDPALLERLMSLGYTAGNEGVFDEIDPFAKTDRFAPHERAAELTAFLHAQSLAGASRRAEAIAAFEPLVADNPHNTSALYELGQLYSLDDTGAHDDRAIELLMRALTQGREWYGPHFFLGQSFRRKGAYDAAEHHLRKAIELNQSFYPAMGVLSVVLLQQGKHAESLEWKNKAFALAGREEKR